MPSISLVNFLFNYAVWLVGIILSTHYIFFIILSALIHPLSSSQYAQSVRYVTFSIHSLILSVIHSLTLSMHSPQQHLSSHRIFTFCVVLFHRSTIPHTLLIYPSIPILKSYLFLLLLYRSTIPCRRK